MRIIVRDDKRIAEIWLTNSEQQDENVQSVISEKTDFVFYRSQFFVCIAFCEADYATCAEYLAIKIYLCIIGLSSLNLL